MPYQPPSPPAARTAIVEVEGADPGLIYNFIVKTTVRKAKDRDNANSTNLHYLEAFNKQVLGPSKLNGIPASIPRYRLVGLDLIIAVITGAGRGFLVGITHPLLLLNCGSYPYFPLTSPPEDAGDFHVLFYLMERPFSRNNLYFTFVYFHTHNLAALYAAVIGHAIPYWRPFPSGERKTEDRPSVIASAALDRAANHLRQNMSLADLEELEIHVRGFLHVQQSFDITDMGFKEVVRICWTIVNKAFRRP